MSQYPLWNVSILEEEQHFGGLSYIEKEGERERGITTPTTANDALLSESEEP